MRKKGEKINRLNIDADKLQWQAPDFEYNPKDVSWYWLSLMAAIIFIAFALWQRNFLFIIFVAVAWFTIISLTRKTPQTWEFKLDEKGMEIVLAKKKSPAKFYPVEDIKGFDIREFNEDYKELVLKLSSRLSPFLKINFPSQKEEAITAFLLKFASREEYDESLTDSLAKLIRF